MDVHYYLVPRVRFELTPFGHSVLNAAGLPIPCTEALSEMSRYAHEELNLILLAGRLAIRPCATLVMMLPTTLMNPLGRVTYLVRMTGLAPARPLGPNVLNVGSLLNSITSA